MPFVDTNDDVFLGEKSFATWHEALDRYEIMAVGTRLNTATRISYEPIQNF